MLLARRGFKVTLFEKKTTVGGRNAELRLGEFSFDTGPTFLMMKEILDKVFEEAGAASDDYLDFKRLEPMYRLQFDDFHLDPTTDPAGMKAEIARHFPGKEDTLDAFMSREGKRFEHLFPCLQKPYHQLRTLASPTLLRAVPHLALGRTIFDLLYSYFGDERLALAFTFQSKYLGMSPWDCPALFAILPYIEHKFGVYHTQGGLCRISRAMADVGCDNGLELVTGEAVRQVLVESGRARGVLLENGDEVTADAVVINADFGYAMTELMPPDALRKYTREKVARRRFSCSTFMLYLGLDVCYDAPHHTIVFARDYRENVEEVFNRKVLSDDISFYVRNASVTDPGLAPPGKSAVYILVPVPNLAGEIDWENTKTAFRDLVLDAVAANTPMTDIRDHIEVEEMICPSDWEADYDVYRGATFNLTHDLRQMIYLRPHNAFEDVADCYLVGGGTHPGSGLPTIYESGRISAGLIVDRFGWQ